MREFAERPAGDAFSLEIGAVECTSALQRMTVEGVPSAAEAPPAQRGPSLENLPRELQQRILFFLEPAKLPPMAGVNGRFVDDWDRAHADIRSLSLTSRQLAAVARRSTYVSVLVRSDGQLARLLANLIAFPEAGSFIRELYVTRMEGSINMMPFTVGEFKGRPAEVNLGMRELEARCRSLNEACPGRDSTEKPVMIRKYTDLLNTVLAYTPMLGLLALDMGAKGCSFRNLLPLVPADHVMPPRDWGSWPVNESGDGAAGPMKQMTIDTLTELRLNFRHRQAAGYFPVHIGLAAKFANLQTFEVSEAIFEEGDLLRGDSPEDSYPLCPNVTTFRFYDCHVSRQVLKRLLTRFTALRAAYLAPSLWEGFGGDDDLFGGWVAEVLASQTRSLRVLEIGEVRCKWEGFPDVLKRLDELGDMRAFEELEELTLDTTRFPCTYTREMNNKWYEKTGENYGCPDLTLLPMSLRRFRLNHCCRTRLCCGTPPCCSVNEDRHPDHDGDCETCLIQILEELADLGRQRHFPAFGRVELKLPLDLMPANDAATGELRDPLALGREALADAGIELVCTQTKCHGEDLAQAMRAVYMDGVLREINYLSHIRERQGDGPWEEPEVEELWHDYHRLHNEVCFLQHIEYAAGEPIDLSWHS